MARTLGAPVEITITQYQVGTSALAAERAQLQAAQAKEEAALAHAESLAERLALVAGVTDADVLIDRERRQATVAARPLDEAGLAAYRELERRIAAVEPEWRVRLRPPARPLPEIPFEDGEPTEDGEDALGLIAWAGLRVPAPIILSGPEEAVELAAERLRAQGVAVRTESGGGAVSAKWGAPDE
jgi:hypothetical protein